MVLRYSVGKAVSGRVCASDAAYGALERQIDSFEMGPAWNWFVERAAALESELEAVGGFDERIAEQLEATGSIILRVDAAERYERAGYICWQLEEAATAFIVTVQPRLNALNAAANAVYEKATKEDSLPVTVPRKLDLFPPALIAIWNVANYVKHRDEWALSSTKYNGRLSRHF